MKRGKSKHCNHCGGIMRTYMDGAPTCLSCGRYEYHACNNCISIASFKSKKKGRKRLAA